MPLIDTTEKFRYLFTKVTDRVYEQAGKGYERTFKKIMKAGDTSEPDYRSASIVGFGQHFQKTDIGRIRYDSLVPGRERITTWKTYALGWRVSDRFMRDATKSTRARNERIKKFANFTKRARLSAEWTMEASAAHVIMNLDSATADPIHPGAGSDGKAFAAADHPLLKSSDVGVNISTAADLTSTALQDAITMLRRQPDERGRRGGYSAKRFILVIGPMLEWKAETIFNTDQVAGSNFNDADGLNKYKKRITVVIMDELDDWDGWLLLDADNIPLEYFINMEPTFTNQKDFETSVHLFKSETEFSFDFHDWRGAVLDPGT